MKEGSEGAGQFLQGAGSCQVGDSNPDANGGTDDFVHGYFSLFFVGLEGELGFFLFKLCEQLGELGGHEAEGQGGLSVGFLYFHHGVPQVD